MTRPSLPCAGRPRVLLGLILLLALPAFGLACNGDTAPPTGPEFGKGGIATVVVNSLADNGTGTCTVQTCTLRDAIATAPAGATVAFADNLCGPGGHCTITLSSTLFIDKNLTITGHTAYALAVDGNNAVEVLGIGLFASVTVTVKNLTISGGNSLFGGGIIHDAGTLTLENVTVSENTALVGGGINNAGPLTLKNSTVSGNTATGTFAGLGGGIETFGCVTLTNSTVSGNSANEGGGIFIFGGFASPAGCGGGALTLTNSTVSGNTASAAGGGIFNNGGGLTLLKRSCVSGNTAPSDPNIAGTITQGTNCP